MPFFFHHFSLSLPSLPLSPFLFLASVTAAYRSIRCFFFSEGTRRVARINVECTRDFESVAISAIVAMERVRACVCVCMCARARSDPSPFPSRWLHVSNAIFTSRYTGNNNDGAVVNIQGCNYSTIETNRAYIGAHGGNRKGTKTRGGNKNPVKEGRRHISVTLGGLSRPL